MDPQANIERQRELAKEIGEYIDENTPDDGLIEDAEIVECVAERGVELAELVQALDEWRLKGGFDPYDPIDLAAVTELVNKQGD